MFRGARIALVAVLAIAVASVPLILDQCAATCEMHHETVASTPACHHSGTATPHLGQTPQPCGHDHNGTSVTPDGGSIPTVRNVAMGTATCCCRSVPHLLRPRRLFTLTHHPAHHLSLIVAR